MEFLSLSRRRSSARNASIGEERGETDVFAGYCGCPVLCVQEVVVVTKLSIHLPSHVGRCKKWCTFQLGVQGCIQSVFNLILDIHVMFNWQLSKQGNCWPVSHDCITGSFLQLIEATFFFKVPCWPVIGLQLITGSGPVFSGGIQFVSILCWKLNEVRRILFKNLTRVLLLALAKPIYCYLNLLVDGLFWASPLFSWLV